MRRKLSTFLRAFGPAKAVEYDDVHKVHNKRLITIVDGDTGHTLYGLVGYHLVNRQTHYELDKPWTKEWEGISIFDVTFDDHDPLQLPEVK
jgi:hypothetical protein